MSLGRGRRLLLPAIPMLLVLVQTGCTYICHSYVTPQPLKTLAQWSIYGSVVRGRGPSHPPPERYSWPHWRAAADDRYWVTVCPIASDSTLFARTTIELLDPCVATDDSLIRLVWEDVRDARIEGVSTALADSATRARYIRSVLTTRPLTFESSVFHLPLPPPDSLRIRFDLRVLDLESGIELLRYPIRAWAVIDRHRRWAIIDAAES
jgi:hypothetical protein